jgi:hypothetical protein
MILERTSGRIRGREHPTGFVFARLSEARLKPLGFGVAHLPVLVALQDGRASTQRDLARFAKIEQPPMAQRLAREWKPK